MSLMYPTRNDPPPAKPVLLSCLMIGLLALSVALAWLTTKPKKNLTQAGAEIISQLADETLNSYWGDEANEEWFIGLKHQRFPVNWSMRSRKKTPGDIFAGEISGGVSGVPASKAEWRLNADLSGGLYLARVYDRNRDVLSETQTTLTEKKITVARAVGDQRLLGHADRPPNYVPEGSLPLVLALAARDEKTAEFKIMHDSSAISDGSLNFVTVRVTPLGDNAVQADFIDKRGKRSSTYVFDSELKLLREVDSTSGTVSIPHSKDVVVKTFKIPQASPSTTKPAPRAP